MPLVSIITPAWNAANQIGETIASVRAQTLRDWELVVADDCSTDDTRALVEQASLTDPRIRLVRQARNAGPAMARQAAIEHSSGRYLAFLDSDDLWLPEKLERQIAFSRDKRAALTYTAFRRISEDGERVGRLITVPPFLDYGSLLKNTGIATLTAMIDREISGPVAMRDEPYDDFCLWLSMLARGHVAHGLNEDLARYRVRGGSVSSKPLRSAGWVWHIYRKVERLSLLHAIWCMGHWSTRAVLKRRRF